MAQLDYIQPARVVESFLQRLAEFSYDRAREVVDKQKESLKSNQSSGQIWTVILGALSQLAVAEKSYSSFLYLSSKWFGRKDAKSLYDIVALECRKVENLSQQRLEQKDLQALAHICTQLIPYVSYKSEMIDFFTSLQAMIGVRFCDRSGLLAKVKDILEKSQDKFFHPLLEPLKNTFLVECEIIEKLLETDCEMSRWSYMSSLLSLQTAVSTLNQRLSVISVSQAREPWKLSFMGMKTASSVPALYSWLKQYKDAIYSKFTLYFYDTLNKQAPADHLKQFTSKCTIDYYTKITAFHRKTDAYLVALVMDMSQIGVPAVAGYVHPDTPEKHYHGTEAYPAIFCYPQEALDKQDGRGSYSDMPHLPNVHIAALLMLMERKEKQLNQTERPIDEYDSAANCTYFVSRIDPRVTLVIIYQIKKSERDKKSVIAFLQDIGSQLRYTKLFSELRPS